jgi:hypothetical protein
MKRMTLLTALALVFSLFTVAAAIAGSGLGTGDSEQSGALDRIQAETQPNEAACQADDCPAGDAARTQTREMVKSGDCQADDCPADEAPITQAQMRERLTNQILEMLGSKSAEVEAQYRHILNFMLQNMLRFRVVLFV